MARPLLSVLSTLALVGAGVLAGAGAAQASSIYPPSDSCRVTPSAATAGTTVVFSCAARTFGANEDVKLTVTGENGRGTTFGMVRFAVSTGAYDTASGAEGDLAGARITLPSDASGIYNIAAVSPSSAGGTASVTVGSADSSLSATGGDPQTVALWAGGAVLLLGGGAVALIAAARRRRDR